MVRKRKAADALESPSLTTTMYGKLTVIFAKSKSYLCGSLCHPKHIVTVTQKQSKDHRAIMERCVALATENKSKAEIKNFVTGELTGR